MLELCVLIHELRCRRVARFSILMITQMQVNDEFIVSHIGAGADMDLVIEILVLSGVEIWINIRSHP